MSNIDKRALREAAEKATQGKWWSDSCVEGFTSYAVYDENNQILLDTLNSAAACISEEYDGEGHVAWDEVGQRNADFVAAANPATVLALLDELEAAEKRIAELEARQLVVKIPAYVDGRTLGYGEVNHMIDLCVDAFERACHSAGINLTVEG